MNNKLLLILLSLIAPLAFLASLLSGHTILSWDSPILWQIRMPLSITAFVVGAMLALSGLYLQILLNNPLADPSILGISGGCATFYLFGLLAAIPSMFLPGISLLGGIISILFLTFTSRSFNSYRLLLSGVILASGWGAIISLILILLPNQSLHNSLFWLLGDLSLNTPSYSSLFFLVLFTTIGLILAPGLNLLALGELHAKNLGVKIKQHHWMLFMMSSLLTAFAVTTAGCIGFVGLITPHILRLLNCHDHRYLVPGTVLCGGSLVCLANALSRLLAAPMIIPVGIMTCCLGVPLVLVILQRRAT